MRTNEELVEFLQPLEKLIHNKLIPAVGRLPRGSAKRKHFELPSCLGGLEIVNSLSMKLEFMYSKKVSTPLLH